MARHDTKPVVPGRELTFRLLAAVALGCHAFFHGIWIAGFLLRPG